MFGLAIVQNRTLARVLQSLALFGVLVPLTTTQAGEPRLPFAKQTKRTPTEVRVPVGQGAIPPAVVVVSDIETPKELPVPAAGELRAGPPLGYATQTAGTKPDSASNRYATPATPQGAAPNPLPGFSAPKALSSVAPQAPAGESLEPITGEQEPMPTPAGQEEPLSLEPQGSGETIRPLPPKRTTQLNSVGEAQSILSSTKSASRAPAGQSNSGAPNSEAAAAAPRYAPTASDTEPQPTPVAETTEADPNVTPAGPTPLAAEADETNVPVAAAIENAGTAEDAPVPFAPIPVPVPKSAAVPKTAVVPSTAPKLEVGPATFRDVEPGVTTLEQLITAWGEPIEKQGQAGEMALLYKIEPFAAVQIRTSGDVVTGILIRLEGTLAPEPLAERLQLDAIRTVEVRDEQGQPLGRAFPDRGVLFGYDPSVAEPAVAQVLLETIDPQAFYLRAETYWRSQAAASLKDLNYVVEQAPGDAAAQHLAARIYLSLGQVDVALEAVDKARELDPEDNEFRLTRAQCLAQLGREKEAEAEASAVRLADGISLATKGRAFLLLGDLLSSGSKRNYKGAIALHMEAIKLVEPLAADPLVATRRKAKEVLLEATLAVARDVAWGNWNRKEEVVPKWIEKADAYAREAIEHDGAGLELRMMVIERALAAHAGFKPAVDPARFLSVAEELTTRLAESTKDPLAQQAAEWELGRVYNHAVRLAHLRGTVDEGFKYGQIAQDKLENAAAGRGSSLQARYEIGALYFHIGALHAVHQQNHEKAVEWYDRAQKLLLVEENRAVEDPGELGEMLVSMGVSYWSVDLKQKGLELTALGTSLVKQAVDQGTVAADSLVVPYGNLSSMHAELGHAEKAREINITAEKLQQTQLK